MDVRKRLCCAAIMALAAQAGAQDLSEYAAILALDETTLLQLGNGWHGGVTLDNAVHPDDGSIKSGFDVRYQGDAQRFSLVSSVVDGDTWYAASDYRYLFLSNESFMSWARANVARDRGVLERAGSDTEFDDIDDSAMLALGLDGNLDHFSLNAELQRQWRRFSREGTIELPQQSVALDVDKDFTSYGLQLSLDYVGDVFEAGAWSRVARVTDTDVSVCLDEACLLSDAIEDQFTIYQGGYRQVWYRSRLHTGLSVATELAGYTSNVDHLPSNYRFSIGGMYSVRGYDEGAVGGDEAAWLRNELRWAWKSAAFGLDRSALQRVYMLYDWGGTRQSEVEAQLAGETFTLLASSSDYLRAAGVGVSLSFRRGLSLTLEGARVLAAVPGVADEGDIAVHALLDWRAF